MRSAWLVLLAALIATTPARAGGPLYPAVPPEVGVAPFIGPTWEHLSLRGRAGDQFLEPPALYRGYAYRPYYRYSAYLRLPRTYFCITD
ncbi:hypothetical protein ACVWWR_007386 [Bradyrhizobium sp. LM3.2]